MNAPPDPLSHTLGTWRIAPPGDPQFRSAVWARLQAARDTRWAAYVRQHAAASCAALALAVSLLPGAAAPAEETRIVGYLIGSPPPGQGMEAALVFYLLNLSQCAAVLGTLLIFRAIGFRLVRMPALRGG